jgi:phenylalanyl-tRNA synthetase beta chain
MQVSYKWLQEYIAFDWSPDELARRLTMIGTAVERITPLYEKFSGVRIARIEKVDRHSGQDRLSLCTINDGTGVRVVVCGAPNVHPGLYAPYAMPGAVLPGGMEVKTATIAGVSSPGFLCSEAELGLSEESDRIMELDPEAAETGMDLWEFLDLDDWIMQFELTPNRPDCMSALGLAREIGALIGTKVRRPELELHEGGGAAAERVTVQIDDPDGCPRYAARIVDNIEIKPSPFWLKRRLHAAGMRSLNNIVDIANYIMIETGQPLHAFDFATFSRPNIVVRAATAGEEFTTLDNERRAMPADAVMITDGAAALAVGGIMGGLASEVSAVTRAVLLESAYFNPSRIRRTRKQLGLASEAALRFEKGVDPNGVGFALDRAAALMAELAGGQVLQGAVDVYPAPVAPLRLEVRPVRVNKIIGVDLASPRMIDILSALEFGVTGGKTIAVAVPTFRPDITREIDLIEEIARIADYGAIPVRRKAAGRIPTAVNPLNQFETRIKEILVGEGLFEVVTNSLVDPRRLTPGEAGLAVKLKNPLSEELSVMRASLCGSLLQVVAHNLNRQVPTIAIFEIGRVFQQVDGVIRERHAAAVMLAGNAFVTRWETGVRAVDFYDLKGILVTMCRALRLELELCAAPYEMFADRASFELRVGETPLGSLGLIAPELARRYDVKIPVWAAFLDFDKLERAGRATAVYRPLPRFPKAERDCAVIVSRSVKGGDLVETVKRAAPELIEQVDIFDVYTGKPIAADKKSVAISVSYRAEDRTLTDAQVNDAHSKAVELLKNCFNAELRE